METFILFYATVRNRHFEKTHLYLKQMFIVLIYFIDKAFLKQLLYIVHFCVQMFLVVENQLFYNPTIFLIINEKFRAKIQ